MPKLPLVIIVFIGFWVKLTCTKTGKTTGYRPGKGGIFVDSKVLSTTTVGRAWRDCIWH